MRKITLLLASAIMVSGTSMASDLDDRLAVTWPTDFRRADLNDSGGLSKLELDKTKLPQLQPVKDNFKAIDLDRDGHVTQVEYEQFLNQTEEKIAERFRQADLNDSGGVSRKELDKVSAKEARSIKKNFAAIDADNDGQITVSEYMHYQNATGKMNNTAAERGTVRADQCQPDCGYVTLVDRYKVEGEGGMLGAIAGGVAGGLLGNQVGGGSGKTVATVGGAAGGAYVGHQVEKRYKTKKMVKVTVKLDNGQQQDFDFEADKSPFPKGARVQIKDGQLTAYTGQ